MKIYIVNLESGASFFAKKYYEINSTEYCFEVVTKKGTFDFVCLKSEVTDIREVSEEDFRIYEKCFPDKENYYLDPSYSMYDMAYCMAKCKKDCARKKDAEGICTVSDFTAVCSEFEPEE